MGGDVGQNQEVNGCVGCGSVLGESWEQTMWLVVRYNCVIACKGRTSCWVYDVVQSCVKVKSKIRGGEAMQGGQVRSKIGGS